MDPITNSIDGNDAFEMHQKVSTNELKRRELFLDNMKLIHELKSTGLYKTVLGDENASWSAYLSQFEVFYTKGKVYTMDKIYEMFVTKLDVPVEAIAHIPHSKLSNLLSIVTKDNVIEWLTKATSLTSQDFNDEVRKAHGKVSYLDCTHERKSEFVQCEECGFKHKK